MYANRGTLSSIKSHKIFLNLLGRKTFKFAANQGPMTRCAEIRLIFAMESLHIDLVLY